MSYADLNEKKLELSTLKTLEAIRSGSLKIVFCDESLSKFCMECGFTYDITLQQTLFDAFPIAVGWNFHTIFSRFMSFLKDKIKLKNVYFEF